MRRIHCGPARWHIFARGTRRLELFRDDQDYSTFINCLIFALLHSGCELWAYALMSNHYHLVLFGSSSQIAECMYQVNKQYARYHNRRYSLGGHVFDGPYQALRIPTAGSVLWTLAYVFLNPVKAGLSGAPEDYPWSGYAAFRGRGGSPIEIASASVMSRIELPLDRAWDLFHNCMERQLQAPPKRVSGRPNMIEVHRSQFQWLKDHAETTAAPMPPEDRLLLAAHWARQCGIAPRGRAMEIEETDPAKIRRNLHSFRKRIAANASLRSLAEAP